MWHPTTVSDGQLLVQQEVCRVVCGSDLLIYGTASQVKSTQLKSSIGWDVLYGPKKFRYDSDKIDRSDSQSKHIKKSDNSRRISPQTGFQPDVFWSWKIQKNRFLRFFVFEPKNSIFNFKKKPVCHDIRPDLSNFSVCLDPHNDLPILSEII